MKLAIFALALLLAGPALAQEPPQPQPEPGGQARPEGERREGRDRRGGGGMGLPVERITEELGLTPEQAQQVEAINQEMRERGRTLMREAFQSGDPSAARERIRGLFEESFTRLEALLTPEQKEKAQGMRERLMERMQSRMRDMGPGGPGGGRGGRQQTRARLREEALRSLALSEEEAAVVTPLLDGCLETRELLLNEAETRRQGFLEKVRATSDAEALAKLLEEFRLARQADESTVKQSMDQLREVLTVEQEAKLVGLGILD